MGKTCKTSVLLLTVIIAVSCLTLLTVKPASFQSTTEPTAPRLSLNYVDSSIKSTQTEIATIAETASALPTPSTQPTPYQLVTPSTKVPSNNHYSVPPLSSLRLSVQLSNKEPCYGTIYIYGGSGNDINLKIINPDGNIVRDFGRISNESSFKFYADKKGNFTFILDNEFSVLSSKEVVLYKNPFGTFTFAGVSINFWVIILVVISFVALTFSIVWYWKRRSNLRSYALKNRQEALTGLFKNLKEKVLIINQRKRYCGKNA